MDELGVTLSFGPLDVLESISRIYSAKQLSRVEEQRISADMERLYYMLEVQIEENKLCREEIKEGMKVIEDHLSIWTDRCIQNPESEIYQKNYAMTLNAYNSAIRAIGDVRVGRDWGRINEI